MKYLRKENLASFTKSHEQREDYHVSDTQTILLLQIMQIENTFFIVNP